MNVKKEVIESIKKKLTLEQHQLKRNCERNKYKMKTLAEEQEVMKREIAKLGSMIKDLDS